MAKARPHKKNWNKKLTKRELIQAWFAMAKGNKTLKPFSRDYTFDKTIGGVLQL